MRTSNSIEHPRPVRDARWVLYQTGHIASEELPTVAVEILAECPDDVDIANLAGRSAGAPRPLNEDLFDEYGRDTGLPFLADGLRRPDLAWMAVRAIRENGLTVEQGALLVLEIVNYAPDGRYVEDKTLEEIASYASVLNEFPDQRASLLDTIQRLVDWSVG